MVACRIPIANPQLSRRCLSPLHCEVLPQHRRPVSPTLPPVPHHRFGSDTQARCLDPRPGVRFFRQALREAREQHLGQRTAHRPLSRTSWSSSRRQASTLPCPLGHAGTPRIRTFRQAGRIRRRSDRPPASRDWPQPTRTGPNVLTLRSGYAPIWPQTGWQSGSSTHVPTAPHCVAGLGQPCDVTPPTRLG